MSVLVCTRNRAGAIGVLLESMANLRAPAGLSWEIVVVDNGSSDGTAELIESYVSRMPVRRAYEPTPGVSNARNLAVATARGRYICWTDDDAKLDPKWLAAYVRAFERHPDAAIFGGRVIPELESPTPPWFSAHADKWPLNVILAVRDFGPKPILLDLEQDIMPWGVNFAVRTEEQRRVTFDPGLGRSPLQRRSGEESQVMYELMKLGIEGWWVPEALVFHQFAAARQSYHYVYEHFASIGETWAYLEEHYPEHCMWMETALTRELVSNPLKLRVAQAVQAAIYGVSRATGLTQRSLYSLRKLGLYDGAMAYMQGKKKLSTTYR